jgi:hypothetical protein
MKPILPLTGVLHVIQALTQSSADRSMHIESDEAVVGLSGMRWQA